MSHENETFFTSVGCMDGRVQNPIAQLGKKLFGADFPDTITGAGLVGRLAQREADDDLINRTKKKIVDVSLKIHNSKGVIVHGHQKCAGNPVDDEQHKRHIFTATSVIKEMLPEPKIPVVPVFVWKDTSKQPPIWVAEEIKERERS